MLRADGAKRRRTAIALVLVLSVAGCGGGRYANDERPPPARSVGAVVTAKGVTVAPAHFEAGPVELLASNQTATSQRVQLRSVRLTEGGEALSQSTGPINPGGTASLTADLAAGTYVVSASASSLAPAAIVVTPARARDADRLLQP
jgi:hypothetical protein